MKKLNGFVNLIDLSIVESLLEAEKIKFSVKNEYLQSLPAMGFTPLEIWVEDKDFDRAQAILQAYVKNNPDSNKNRMRLFGLFSLLLILVSIILVTLFNLLASR